jgi:hypothetical protein
MSDEDKRGIANGISNREYGTGNIKRKEKYRKAGSWAKEHAS